MCARDSYLRRTYACRSGSFFGRKDVISHCYVKALVTGHAVWADQSTECSTHFAIGLYRDVWIAAIASSMTSLATLTGVMCNMSQCELRSLRVNSGMLNVIRIVTY